MFKHIDVFPDGTPISDFFYDIEIPALESLGKKYILTDFGVKDDGVIYTLQIQKLIDLVFNNGGGVIIVPKGTYLSGAIFLKNGVSLYLEKDSKILGSTDIKDYPARQTRIEGETCIYHPALINGDNLENTHILGEGTIDGNGLSYWKAFWKRREEDPNCTNKEVLRPRLVYLSNSKNCYISNICMQNSAFWTFHIYKCNHLKLLNLNIYSPASPVPAPSTDAIDIDACHDILIKGCKMEVNDDAVALKGGKGPWADVDPNNGSNERIIIEDCEYGFCHSGLTCGSESIHNNNIILRNIKLNNVWQLTHFKLRADTPSHYEYISVSNVYGVMTGSFININPWTQFFDLKGRKDKPISRVHNISYKDIDVKCGCFFNVGKNEKEYELYDFEFENLNIVTLDECTDYNYVKDIQLKNVKVEVIKDEKN